MFRKKLKIALKLKGKNNRTPLTILEIKEVGRLIRKIEREEKYK